MCARAQTRGVGYFDSLDPSHGECAGNRPLVLEWRGPAEGRVVSDICPCGGFEYQEESVAALRTGITQRSQARRRGHTIENDQSPRYEKIKLIT